jgi:hypothetical protein
VILEIALLISIPLTTDNRNDLDYCISEFKTKVQIETYYAHKYCVCFENLLGTTLTHSDLLQLEAQNPNETLILKLQNASDQCLLELRQ